MGHAEAKSLGTNDYSTSWEKSRALNSSLEDTQRPWLWVGPHQFLVLATGMEAALVSPWPWAGGWTVWRGLGCPLNKGTGFQEPNGVSRGRTAVRLLWAPGRPASE